MQPSDDSAELSNAAPERPDAPLGTLIFRAGLVSADQLEDALEQGARNGRRLGEILLERGLIGEEDLARLIAGQRGFQFLSASELRPDPEALELLPSRTALVCQALPLAIEDGVPIVAVADPTDVERLRAIQGAIGKEPRIVMATGSDIAAALSEAYAAQNGPGDVQSHPESVATGIEKDQSATATGLPQQDVHLAGHPPITGEPRREAGPAAFVVVVRLTNGERIEVASAHDPDAAQMAAHSFIRSLAGGDSSDWPLVAGRFIRPDAIVSVDIVEL